MASTVAESSPPLSSTTAGREFGSDMAAAPPDLRSHPSIVLRPILGSGMSGVFGARSRLVVSCGRSGTGNTGRPGGNSILPAPANESHQPTTGEQLPFTSSLTSLRNRRETTWALFCAVMVRKGRGLAVGQSGNLGTPPFVPSPPQLLLRCGGLPVGHRLRVGLQVERLPFASVGSVPR